MPSPESPTIVDRVVERMLYPNIGGKTPGPLAGRGEVVNYNKHPLEPDGGYSYLITGRESRKLKIVGVALIAGLSLLSLIKPPKR